MAQLERAVHAFETDGSFKEPGPFNSEHKALLTEYLESVDTFKKWPEFYQACNFSRAKHIHSEEQDDLVADISQTDIGRRALNFSSSPVKP
jgi:hypothetical protein